MRVLASYRRARPLFGGGVKARGNGDAADFGDWRLRSPGEIALMSTERCRGASECPRMAETPSEQ
jgi:hypothetical protein